MTRRRRPRHDRPAVTRDVEPGSMPDLLDGSHRACLAWVTDTGPTVVPAAARFPAGFDGAGAVRIEAAEALPTAPDEVVVLVDDGVWWYDLRAVYVRGTLRTEPGRPGAPAAAVEPTKVTAWHYGRLRAAR